MRLLNTLSLPLASALLLLPAIPRLHAQYGPYGYPGAGVGIPMPHVHLPSRKPKDTNGKVTVLSVDGTLRKLDEKELLLQISPRRVLQFRLSSDTEYRGKDGKPISDSLLHPGDRLTVDVTPNDTETAYHVILVHAGKDSERETASAAVDEFHIYTPDKSDFGRPHATTESAESAGSGGGDSGGRPTLQRQPAGDSGGSDDDPGRPTLRRASADDSGSDSGGGRPTLQREASAAQPAAQPAGTPRAAEPRPEAKADPASVDDVIDEARSAARSFSAGLPDFLVQQITTRSQGSRSVDNWKNIDVVTADVASVGGKEEYRNIKVNGRPTDRPEDSGSWSTGEFQVTLEDILSPATAAVFTPRGEDNIAHRPALVYDLRVEQPHSHWVLVAENNQRYKPAYKGTIWIDKETRRVIRIEQQALALPRDFAFDKTEASLEYGFVNIDGTKYLLPIESVNMSCFTGTSNCSRNIIEFRNYRKFTADSNISFDK
jgi:hypothetical protein